MIETSLNRSAIERSVGTETIDEKAIRPMRILLREFEKSVFDYHRERHNPASAGFCFFKAIYFPPGCYNMESIVLYVLKLERLNLS